MVVVDHLTPEKYFVRKESKRDGTKTVQASPIGGVVFNNVIDVRDNSWDKVGSQDQLRKESTANHSVLVKSQDLDDIVQYKEPKKKVYLNLSAIDLKTCIKTHKMPIAQK